MGNGAIRQQTHHPPLGTVPLFSVPRSSFKEGLSQRKTCKNGTEKGTTEEPASKRTTFEKTVNDFPATNGTEDGLGFRLCPTTIEHTAHGTC